MTKITEKNPLVVEREKLQQIERALTEQRDGLVELEMDLKKIESQRVELIRSADSRSLEEANKIHIRIDGLTSAITIKRDTQNILESEVQARQARIAELEHSEECHEVNRIFGDIFREQGEVKSALAECLGHAREQLRTLDATVATFQARYHKAVSPTGERRSTNRMIRLRYVVEAALDGLTKNFPE